MTLKDALKAYPIVIRLGHPAGSSGYTVSSVFRAADAIADDWVEYKTSSTLKGLSLQENNTRKLRRRAWDMGITSIFLWYDSKGLPQYTMHGTYVTHLLEGDTNTDWYVVDGAESRVIST